MSDTDTTNQETGVGGQGSEAPSDDQLDTELFDRVEAPDDDDEPEPADAGEEEPSNADKAKTDEDPDSEEVEHAGKKYRIPKAILAERMMQQDYTRKTQELGEHRRALETERATFETQRQESLATLPEEHARVAVLTHSIAAVNRQLDTPDAQGITLRDIDWTAFRLHAQGSPEMGDLYRDYRARYDAARETLDDLSTELGSAKNDLKTKEDQRLQSQREASQEALAKAQEETGKVLAREIEGWGPERANTVAKFAIEQAGIAPDELREMTDPRTWKVLDRLIRAEERAERAEASLKQHQTAKQNAKVQEVKPAEKAKGTGGVPRDPATPRGDGLSTEEWRRRRLAQKQAKAH